MALEQRFQSHPDHFMIVHQDNSLFRRLPWHAPILLQILQTTIKVIAHFGECLAASRRPLFAPVFERDSHNDSSVWYMSIAGIGDQPRFIHFSIGSRHFFPYPVSSNKGNDSHGIYAHGCRFSRRFSLHSFSFQPYPYSLVHNGSMLHFPRQAFQRIRKNGDTRVVPQDQGLTL